MIVDLMQRFLTFGEIPERSKGTVCKTVGTAFAGSNPALATIKKQALIGGNAGIAQLARATAFQAVGCGFESRFPLHLLAFRGVAHFKNLCVLA